MAPWWVPGWAGEGGGRPARRRRQGGGGRRGSFACCWPLGLYHLKLPPTARSFLRWSASSLRQSLYISITSAHCYDGWVGGDWMNRERRHHPPIGPPRPRPPHQHSLQTLAYLFLVPRLHALEAVLHFPGTRGLELGRAPAASCCSGGGRPHSLSLSLSLPAPLGLACAVRGWVGQTERELGEKCAALGWPAWQWFLVCWIDSKTTSAR